MSYEVVGVRRSVQGWLECETCKEPILLMQQGKGSRLVCDRCGWSVYTSTEALTVWTKCGRAEFPLSPSRGWQVGP